MRAGQDLHLRLLDAGENKSCNCFLCFCFMNDPTVLLICGWSKCVTVIRQNKIISWVISPRFERCGAMKNIFWILHHGRAFSFWNRRGHYGTRRKAVPKNCFQSTPDARFQLRELQIKWLACGFKICSAFALRKLFVHRSSRFFSGFALAKPFTFGDKCSYLITISSNQVK